jgi:transcriptional regulator with XRE-family HTH domain
MKRRNRKALEVLEELIGESVTFGPYLKSIRESEELSQTEFAAKLGISVQHLSNVENYRKHVSIERAEAWAKALDYRSVGLARCELRLRRAPLHRERS